MTDDVREAAVLAERNRIAREIHDTLAQGFAAIRLQLELAQGGPGLPPPIIRALDLAYHIASENLVAARRAITVLRSKRPASCRRSTLLEPAMLPGGD